MADNKSIEDKTKLEKAEGDNRSSSNDQLVRTVPGTDVGGHDTAGTDGETRTERPGDILGTPNVEEDAHRVDQRELETKRADFVTAEVDRANREDLPRLGGNAAAETWEEEEGGPPEFLADAKTRTTARRSIGVTTANVPATAPARTSPPAPTVTRKP